MKEKKTVLVLFGGASSEHEVSCTSAASILRRIDRDAYEVRMAGITKEGKWLLTGAQPEAIEKGLWEQDEQNRNLLVSLDTDQKGLFVYTENGASHLPVDVVFPVLHGKNGEDGTVQGLLHMAGIPFVGSDTASSAACMDKGIAKALVSQAEAANQAKCCIIHRSGCDAEEAAEGADAFFTGQYPLFVKPARAGSSVGISKVKRREDLPQAILKAFAEDSKVLVEEMITGRELEVAVLGNDDPVASCVGEIFTAGEFYDYEAKYQDIGSRTEVVRDLPEEMELEIRETALRIYRVLECRGLARVDFFLTEEGRLVFNEINTMPGFTKISMYPALWEASGLSYSGLIDELIKLAFDDERH
ncbi:MAG: D-alanine--D-alanine ligase [Firmicutes bacterium]|nr:D-alanine--D-alanine ligase [Bacillota bacterium]